MKEKEPEPKFELGQLVGTPGAIEALQRNSVTAGSIINRHVTGDWGDLGEEDKELNDEAIQDETRILSAYKLEDGTKVWVITEADRSATTLLLPDEY